MTNGGNGGPRATEGGLGRTGAGITNVYSLDGLLVFGLLLVCTCAYLRKVPRLRTWLLSERRGIWGVCHKAAVIGTRLHVAVSMSCLLMAFYVLVGK
ncbi:protein kish-B isoform 1-T1 [Geothlypis trichas]